MSLAETNLHSNHCVLIQCIEAIRSSLTAIMSVSSKGGLAQWVARLTRSVEVVGLSPIKGPRCFLEQETLPILFSTG